MRPTYDELVVTVESQRNEIKALKKENRNLKGGVEKLQKTVAEIAESVKQLQAENKKLRNELRKYHNKNTPSGSLPLYLKDLEKNAQNMTKDSDEGGPPIHNARNSRPRYIDRREYYELGTRECPHCGGRLIKKKATREDLHAQEPFEAWVLHLCCNGIVCEVK